jgi:hypothetical protein
LFVYRKRRTLMLSPETEIAIAALVVLAVFLLLSAPRIVPTRRVRRR